MTASEVQARLRVLGTVVLLAGVGAGGFLYWRAAQSEVETEEILRVQEQSRAYELAMQKNVGPVGLLMNGWSEQLGSPRGVAVEVALGAALAAGACFFLAAHPLPTRE